MEELATNILFSGVTSSAVVFVFRTWIAERLKQSIAHEYATELEKHKAELKSGNDVQLAEYRSQLSVKNAEHVERLKANLQVESARHDVQFRHLHAKKADAIAAVYANLRELEQAVSAYTAALELSTDGSREERAEAVNHASTAFLAHFVPNQIYLPKRTADAVRELQQQLFEQARRFNLHVHLDDQGNLDEWVSIGKWMTEKLPGLFAQLEANFRQQLGDEHEGEFKPTARGQDGPDDNK